MRAGSEPPNGVHAAGAAGPQLSERILVPASLSLAFPHLPPLYISTLSYLVFPSKILTRFERQKKIKT